MPKTLLLADDSVVIQKLVALSFANEDIRLVTVYNGDDAIAKIRETRPDVVLTDVVMPGKSGYEVCEAVKSDPNLAHVPVLLLTGTFEAFDEDRAARAGSDGHITKPFEAQALVDRVNQLLAAPRRPAAAPAAAAPPAAKPAAAPAAARPATPPAMPSTPAARMPSRPAATEVAASGDVYDFFDDDLDAPLEARADEGVLSFNEDEVEIGSIGSDPLAGMDDALTSSRDPFEFSGDPVELGGAPASDRTVAIMPEDSDFDVAGETPVRPSPVEDQPTITASRLFAGPAAPPRPSRPAAPPEPPPTVVAEDTFEPVVAAGQNANPDPMATVLADDSGFGPAMSMDEGPSGDLFADPGASLGGIAGVAEVQAEDDRDPARDSDFEFGFVTPPPTSFEPPPDLEPLSADSEVPDLMERAELDPAGSSAFDVSSSDLGDPFGVRSSAAPPEPPRRPEPPNRPEPRVERPKPMPQRPPAITAPEAVTPAEEEMPEVDSPRFDAPPAPVAAPSAVGLPGAANLSEVMQGRIHETLEKVAWEAFADLSDAIVRQVLERVERVAWEVIPQMAETLIREEIRKLKGDSED